MSAGEMQLFAGGIGVGLTIAFVLWMAYVIGRQSAEFDQARQEFEETDERVSRNIREGRIR